MIIDALEKQHKFTNSEIKVANYILENYNSNLLSLTSKELGEKTYTSKSTILRLCKKTGVYTYSEFIRKLEVEFNEKERVKQLLNSEPVNENTNINDIVNIVPSLYDKALTNTKISLNYQSLNQIIKILNEANIIDIYGVGISYDCASTAKFKFQSIGLNCSAHNGLNEHYALSTKRLKNRVAIVISFTGENEIMVSTAKFLKGLGTYIIGIGSDNAYKLKKECNEYLDIYSKELIMSMEMVAPFISITYVFDLLFTALLTSNFNKNLQYSLDVIDYKNILNDET